MVGLGQVLSSAPALILIKRGRPLLILITLGPYKGPHGMPVRCKWPPALWRSTNRQSCIQNVAGLLEILLHPSIITIIFARHRFHKDGVLK